MIAFLLYKVIIYQNDGIIIQYFKEKCKMQNDEKQIYYKCCTMHIEQLRKFQCQKCRKQQSVFRYSPKCIFMSDSFCIMHIPCIYGNYASRSAQNCSTSSANAARPAAQNALSVRSTPAIAAASSTVHTEVALSSFLYIGTKSAPISSYFA